MELKNVVEALKGVKAGSFTRVGWLSNIESAKARKAGITVVKLSEATVRTGIKYSNIHAVQVAKANQEGETKQVTVWFKHVEDLPGIIEHLSKGTKYLQLFPVTRFGYPKATYLINGKPATRDEVIASGYCNPSTFAERTEPTLVFNIPIENLRFIGAKNRV